jgi:hypothetical protein
MMENLSLTYVSTLSGKDLVEKYNELTGKNVTRFSSLLDGRKRVYEELNKSRCHDDHAKTIIAEFQAEHGVAPQVKRSAVTVDGVTYSSTAAAFKALGLPMGVHIRFRMKLKAEGSAEINGKKFII